MKRELKTITLSLILVFGIASTAYLFKPYIVLNITPSLPIGIYKKEKLSTEIKTGDLVVISVPKNSKDFIKTISKRINTLLKPVAAGAGDEVCIKNSKLFINQTLKAQLFKTDLKGRVLPKIKLCRKLKAKEYYLLSVYKPNSFDSRYFGPVTQKNIISKAKPLLTF